MSTPLVKLEDVNFYYNRGKPSEVHALKNINIEIERGGYAAFFGPSGCGKTTLTYLIGGIETENCDEGSILINGRDLRGLTKKELAVYRQIGVGIIFQQFNLLPSLSVVDNVALPMAFLGISAERRRKEAMKLLDRFNMTEKAERFPSELSGGQQQRVSIARALANNPPVIIADEPLGNLDSENANKTLEFLKELNEQDGRTIIMVTHESWSLRDAKTILYLKDGEVTKVEEPRKKHAAQKTLTAHLYRQLYPESTPERLMARSLSYMFLRGFSGEEIKRFELFLTKRLTGEINTITFIEFLDLPFKEGGLGLWKQRAQKIAYSVEEIATKRKTVDEIYQELEHDPETPLYEEVAKMRSWLLEDYRGLLSDVQLVRFDEAVEDRFRNIISPDNFRQVLELSKTDFGVGLASGTVRNVSERLETILTGKHYEVLH
ncbi:MAG: ABC transporter ATP-binding protein [Candidatus Yonathbacteria bacterium]|nr:ABC transporter ATP-binding protein [Candidatus Yonathbacteria bacterium]